jgi:3-hydroxyacyl-[acyl-carrier-protein] dehydratase
LAQTGGILVGEVNGFREKVILAKVPRAEFRREVLAGEQLVYDAEILHLRPEGAAVRGLVSAGGAAVGEAEIFFAHLDQSRSRQLFGEHNFVFTGEMKYLLGRLGALAGEPRPEGAG